ncbi:protachykinin-1 [Anarrhichthys ocellatus]|uniref:protachykinin-1 n=1 Tax=Anarrhichthys ocellatus TaxID=433405 RepID=UPI0012EDAFD8|nr:protachykinin-1 [Anarrhichthys ocellatus]
MMKLVILPVLMAFFAVAQVFCEENDPKEDADYWTNSNDIQDGWLANDPFREILLRMTRKPRPHQFIGLMGKRSMANAQITRKMITSKHMKTEKKFCNQPKKYPPCVSL